MSSLFQELKRRKVFRVAVAYAVVAWVLIQISSEVLPALQMPQWTVSFVTVLLLLGFPVALLLGWAFELTPNGIKPDLGVQPQTQLASAQSQRLNYAIFALVLLAVGFQISDRFVTTTSPALTRTEQSTQLARFSLHIPQDEYFHPARGDFDLSDDGSTFVYLGVDNIDQAATQLWIRQWDGSSGKPISGATPASRPKISPDGQQVAFHSQSSVMLASIRGGNAKVLVETASATGSTPNWSPNGLWIYFSNFEGGISRIASSGGEEEVLTLVDTGIGDESHSFVDVLAEDRIVYSVSGASDSRIQAANLATAEVKDLTPGGYPIYSPTGHLLFQAANERTLMAAPFDALALELTGPAVVLAEGLLSAGISGLANVAISNTGRLIYRTGPSSRGAGTPMWVDRDGVALEIDPGWQTSAINASSSLALSPSGDRLAISLSDIGSTANQDLWIKRLDDGPLSRVTFTSGDNTNHHPSWSPDGQFLLYMFGLRNSDLWSRRADGSGSENLLLKRPGSIYEAFYSSDSSWLIFRELNESHDIFALQTTIDAEPIPLVVNGSNSVSPALSPDDKWLAYASDETGNMEIYVRPFPETDSGRWQISSNGGVEPVWAHGGKELFYRNGNQEMVSVEISPGATFDWVDQDILFSTAGYRIGVRHPAYDISPDDQRFVMIKYDSIDNTELIMVENWFEELNRLAPPELP